VVGLAAGRLCQKYHAPTCVLSEREGMLHGSLRSVRGVNIFECLTACADLLARFGGHEQAAGVTLEAANFEAFRDRLTEIVREKAPADALAPEQEIDLPLPLSQATAGLCEELERLAPFGFGNPAPVFLCEGAAVERMRACGAEGAHLQLTLRQGASALDGIAFGMGALAQRPPETADAAFALQFNEFRGQRRLQMEVKALRPSRESEKAALRRAPLEKEQRSLLDAIAALQAGKRPSHGEMNKAVPGMETLLAGRQGTLLIARTRGMALAVLERCGERLDFCVGTAEDPRCFHTLLLWPDMDKLGGDWRRCVLLDGALDEKESAFVRARLPKAELYAAKPSAALKALAASIDAGDEALRGLYKRLRGTVAQSVAQTAFLSGLTPGQALAGLRAFDELGLIELGESPFSLSLCEPKKCSLAQSALLRVLRALSTGEGGAAVC
ncbi:MAG: DHHA1 domain-containing protein, partial [Eubacteriales bacterium]|nr:DHHA1 domain-containing protein [Eubacteriales bacterium]